MRASATQDDLYVTGFAAVICFGLRNTILVTEQRVTIVKHWFWHWTVPGIESVWFGGDWGEADGAIGVVVQLGKREIHIGSSKAMHELHAALEPFAVRWREDKRNNDSSARSVTEVLDEPHASTHARSTTQSGGP